jgi:hypothetical protein
MPAAVVYAIGAAIAVAGAVYSGEQSRKAASQNADIQEQAAANAEAKAKYDEERHRKSVDKLLSAQRALYGKSGLDMSGSPLLVMEDTAAQGELDALAIRYGGSVTAGQQRSAANLSRMEGSSAQTSSYFKAGSSLLTGASAYGSKTITKANQGG